MGFETTISAFERAKAVHALDRAATAIGAYPLAMGELSRMSGEYEMLIRMLIACARMGFVMFLELLVDDDIIVSLTFYLIIQTL
jgi:hypothetical protein